MYRKLLLASLALASQITHAGDFTGKGTYLLAGGRAEPAIFEKFVELAGGPEARIVVIPTASKSADREDADTRIKAFFYERTKATHVTVTHTRDRKIADSDEFVAPILAADGVWLWGGQARRFMDVYSDTHTARALHTVADRGGLIGGTSSGAVVVSDLVIRPGDVETSAILPENNISGIGLIKGVMLDVHAIARNRPFPMLRALPDYPDRIAISIDENTAIILKDDKFEVIGRSYVVVYGVNQRPEPFTFLSAGDRFSLQHNMMTAKDCSLWSSGCIELN